MSTFFTFPLAVLAMPADEKEILYYAIACAVTKAGAGTSTDTIDEERIEDFVKKHGGEAKIGYRKSDAHDQIVRGCIACSVGPGSVSDMFRRDRTVNDFVEGHEHAHGAGPLVFIGSQILWECMKGEFKWRDFTVLCSINSIIGRKKTPVLIRRSMITARQMGYKSPRVMDAELAPPSRQCPARQQLTPKELRTSLDRLEKRGLFVRCQTSMRSVYFAKGITREELRRQLLGKMRGKQSLQSVRDEDRALFQGQSPPEKMEDMKGPLNKGGANMGPQEGPQKGPREGPLKEQLLNNSSKEQPLNNSILNNAVLSATPESTSLVFKEMRSAAS